MGRILDEPTVYLGFWHSVLVTLSFIEQGESPLVLWHQVTDKYEVLIEWLQVEKPWSAQRNLLSPNATLCTVNFTLATPGLKLGLHGHKLVTNHLHYITTSSRYQRTFQDWIIPHSYNLFTGFIIHWPFTHTHTRFSPNNSRRALADWVRTWVRIVCFISSCSLFLSSALPASEPPCEGEF